MRTIRCGAIGAVIGALLPVGIFVAGKACEERGCPVRLALDVMALVVVLVPAALVAEPLVLLSRACPTPSSPIFSVGSSIAQASLFWALVGVAVAALAIASVAGLRRPGKRSLRRLARASEDGLRGQR